MNFKIEKLLKMRTIIFFLVTLMLFFTGCAPTTKAIKETKADTTESSDLKRITDISTDEDYGTSNVWVKSDSTLTYTSVKQPFPLGVLLYFPETDIDDIDTTYTPKSDIVNSIKASKLSSKGHTTRIEILLKKDIPYEVTRDFSGIKISFNKKSSVVPASYEKEAIKEASVHEKTSNETMMETATMLASVDATALESSTTIAINADGMIKDYKSLTVDNPARIVFDLYNVKSPYKTEQSVPVDSKWVKQIRHYGYPDRVRVVLDTTTEYLSAFSAKPVDKGLSIKVGDKKTEQRQSSEKELLTAQASTGDQSEPMLAKQSSTWINRIDFSSEDDGKSTLIVGTTTPVKYDLKKIHDKKILLKLFNAKLPDYRQRPLITTRFNSAVDRIIPFQMPDMKDSTLVAIELRESVPYYAEQTDDILMLHFEASSIPPKTLDEAKLPDWKKVMAQAAVEKEDVEPATAMAPGVPAGRFTGKKIALNFYDADIKNVFRILMDVSGKNFVIDKDVTGKVTLSLDKPVPWDQVLDLVLRMNKLDMVYEGDIIRIITHKTYLVEKKEERAKRAEEQKIKTEEKELEPLTTAYIPINYADASADVLPHINALLSPRGKSTVDTRNNKIIVKDTAEIIKQIKETVKQIDQVTPQVIIEARIVEASDTFSRDVGTQYGITAGWGGKEWDFDLDSAAVNPPSSTRGDIGLSFTRLLGDSFNMLDLRLMASETEGQVKIISSPKILTLDNKPAAIKQGLAYPYNRLDADGNTTTEWKDIALELEVTPHVTPDDRVAMKLTVKNNELGAIINNETSFTTKEASTELLVDDGDTIVIGGIRKTRKDTSESGVPFVKEIPLLGWLFKTKAKSDELEELLIFVSPRIVKLEQRTAM